MNCIFPWKELRVAKVDEDRWPGHQIEEKSGQAYADACEK